MTDDQQTPRPPTPTQRLYDLGMAAITKQGHDTRGLFSGGIETAKTGPNAGQLIFALNGSQSPEQTPMEWASQLFDLAGEFQRRTVQLNAAVLSDQLAATLEKKAKVAK